MGEYFTIIGAGAIGAIVGAHLAQAGHTIDYIEANEAHVAAIRDGGLRISGGLDMVFHPPVVLPAEARAPLRHVLLAVKARHTTEALAPHAARLAPDGYVVSLQNGLEEAKIAALVGEARVIGAYLTFGGHYREPGHIVHGGRGTFRIGELDGRITERVRHLCAVLGAVQPVEATTNITGYLWAKLALGAVYFATALVSADVPDLYGDEAYRVMFGALAAEVVSVARACDVAVESCDGFDPSVFAADGDAAAIAATWDAQRRYWMHHEGRRTGVWRDLAQHRRPTEVDQQVGVVIGLAAAHGIAVPRLRALARIVHEVESGARELGAANLEELAGLP